MEFENTEVVALRVFFLLLTVLFGLPGNIFAMCIKARSLKEQGVNGLAYLHLAFVDLLLCMLHAPLDIFLELIGYFNLKNDIGNDFRTIMFILNRHVGLRIFAFTSLTSQITLVVIALFRCWRIFHPFGRCRKSLMIVMLAVPDALTLGFLGFAHQVPPMNFEILNNTSETNLTGIEFELESPLVQEDNITELSTGKTATPVHGLLEPLLMYTILVSLICLSICYSLITFKIQQGYRRLTVGVSETSTKNQAQRNFLNRQMNHVKTQFILILTLLITSMPTLMIALVGFTPNYAVLRLRATIIALGSAINPYVYCLLTGGGRRAAMQFFGRCRVRVQIVFLWTINATTATLLAKLSSGLLAQIELRRKMYRIGSENCLDQINKKTSPLTAIESSNSTTPSNNFSKRQQVDRNSTNKLVWSKKTLR